MDVEAPGYVEQAGRVLLAPSTLEEERAFRVTLARLAGTGLQWGGLLGLVGVFVLVVLNAFLLGRPTMWWYPDPVVPEAFVLWDKVGVGLLCMGAVVVGRAGGRLSLGRTAGFVLAVAVASVSIVHDAYRGIPSMEYLILVYLLAVVAIPYRPWQALFLGGSLTGVFVVVGHFGVPGTAAARPGLVTPGHLVRLGFATILLTGVAVLLYSIRYRQHRARREAEALHRQVAHLERAKSRFFADIAHEFRTPLTLVLGSVREALDGRLGAVPGELQERLERLEGPTLRMKRMTNQLFELAQFDEGALQLSVQEHDLVVLVNRLVPPFRQWAENEGMSFRVDLECDRLDAWVDADRLDHVLSNLLSSAIKHTPEGGAIRVCLRREEEAGILSVRDSGPGVPDEIQARIFGRPRSSISMNEEGAREEEPGAGSGPWIGTGIALAHARVLVKRHRGRLEIESDPGFGTEMTVHLPLGCQHLAEEDFEDEKTGASQRGIYRTDLDAWKESGTRFASRAEASGEPSEDTVEDRPEVLVVDDEAELRGYLCDLLADRYRVVTAADGDTGLALLRDRRSDLVISNVAMPGTDGLALCRAIREDEQLRHLPVILLTARQDDDVSLSELKVGADAYISKPFDPLELEARVENLIEIRRIVQDRVRLPDWMPPAETTVSPEDADFLDELHEIVDEHIDNSTFGVDWLAHEVDLSARHLRRRIKEVTGLSSAGFIRTRRLQHAASLLRQGIDTVSEVSSAVGYRDPSHFSRLFRDTFGCSPTEYAEKEREQPEEPDTSP